MLTQLSIQNFALIESAEIYFDQGMTVLTGETGVGKSILLDALRLVLGQRGDSQLIRPGSKQCDMSASFDIESHPEVRHWLQAHDLPDDLCILRRVLQQDGRSRCYINGQPMSAQTVQQLSQSLIQIHGQHQQQDLLRREACRTLLDHFADVSKEVAEVALRYQHFQAAQHALTAQRHTQQEQAQLELLRYQHAELEQFDLKEQEIQTLETEWRQFQKQEAVLTACQQTLEELKGNGAERSILDSLHRCYQQLAALKSEQPKLLSAQKLIEESRIQLSEAVDEIEHFLTQNLMDELTANRLRLRLDQLHDLARKHRVHPHQLWEHYQQLREKIAHVENKTQSIETLEQNLAEATAAYFASAQVLSQKRQAATATFSETICTYLKKLSMPHAKLQIELIPIADNLPHPFGIEHVEFLASFNPGQPLMPLAKIASGGELSRLSLAIQVMCAKKAALPTLIFDEVDTGVGGTTAAMIGQLMQQLGQKTQVLCVTHLPQVAAYAHHHLQVQKQFSNEKTLTCIETLTREVRLKEIARMLGGLTINPETLANAEALLAEGAESLIPS